MGNGSEEYFVIVLIVGKLMLIFENIFNWYADYIFYDYFVFL